jgi:hypothetical protein
MSGLIVTRKRIVLLLTAAVASLCAAWWWWLPDRQLHRSWEDLLAGVEARNTARLGRLLAEDYTDRWGYSRRTLLDDARLAFFQFENLHLTADKVTFERKGDRAMVTAILRIDTMGGDHANEARVEINRLFTPFTFEWRHDGGYPGSWKLLRFDHPELSLERFKSRW